MASNQAEFSTHLALNAGELSEALSKLSVEAGESRTPTASGVTSRCSTPSTMVTEYTGGNTPQNGPTHEELVLEYSGVYQEMRSDYAIRHKLVKGAHGYQWSFKQLNEVILEYAVFVWGNLDSPTIERLREWLDLTILECDRSHARALSKGRLLAAIARHLPGSVRAAMTESNTPHLDEESIQRLSKAYLNDAYEYQEWLDGLWRGNSDVPPDTLRWPVVNHAARLCATFKQMSAGQLRNCLRQIMPAGHIKAFVDDVSDERLRDAVLAEYEEIREEDADDIVLY